MALSADLESAMEAFRQTGSKAEAARRLGVPVSTLKSRLDRVEQLSAKPHKEEKYVKADMSEFNCHVGRTYPFRETRKPVTHCVIPDVQAKPGVPLDHLTAAGNFIAEKRPDVVICIGDFADMPALSSYDKGKVAAENKRYRYDLESVHKAMEFLMTPIVKAQGYSPRLVMTLGNHEDRITRFADNNPEMHGSVSIADLGYESWGWEVHPFLKIVEIDGIEYVHYVTTGVMGRPASSAAAMLRERQKSCTQGHVQYYEEAIHKKTQQRALMAGCFYQHDEAYLGPQGNSYRRHIIFKHEVNGGLYDKMEVSLDFLRRRYL